MDITMPGVGCIVGCLITRGFWKNDCFDKIYDIIMTCVGLFLIIGSKYHFFGG